MNTADSIVTVMNIHQIIEWSSPSPVTFEIRFCLFRTWSFTRFTNDLDSTDNSNSASSFPMTNCWGHASSWELISSGRPDLSRSVSSFLTDCAVPSRRISSWLGRTFVPFSKKFYQVVPIARTSQNQFSTLEKTKHGHHPTLSSLLRRKFPFDADILFPRSLQILSNCTPEILISITSLLRAYWSRGWYVRRHSCKKAHHWSRFCCDWFFSVLKYHHVRVWPWRGVPPWPIFSACGHSQVWHFSNRLTHAPRSIIAFRRSARLTAEEFWRVGKTRTEGDIVWRPSFTHTPMFCPLDRRRSRPAKTFTSKCGPLAGPREQRNTASQAPISAKTLGTPTPRSWWLGGVPTRIGHFANGTPVGFSQDSMADLEVRRRVRAAGEHQLVHEIAAVEDSCVDATVSGVLHASSTIRCEELERSGMLRGRRQPQGLYPSLSTMGCMEVLHPLPYPSRPARPLCPQLKKNENKNNHTSRSHRLNSGGQMHWANGGCTNSATWICH